MAQTSRVIIAGIDNQNGQLQRGIPVYIYASNPQQPLPVNVAQIAGGTARSLPVTLTGAGGDGKSPVPVNVVQVASKTIDGAAVPVATQN